MQEVFGDVDDLLEMYAEKKATVVLSKDDDNDEPIEPADEEDPDAVAAYEEQLVRHTIPRICRCCPRSKKESGLEG